LIIRRNPKPPFGELGGIGVSLDEQALVARARNGDVAAFERLIAAYQKKVFNLAYRLSGDREDAADLAQEALVRVFRALGTFRERAQFSTWLYRIVVNVCLDHRRSRGRRQTVSLDAPVDGDEGQIPRQTEGDDLDPAAEVERRELHSQVHEAIGRLNPEHRAVLVMRDIQDFSYEEIAAILGVALGTVKSRLNRARFALKEQLQAERRAELSPAPGVYPGSQGVLKGEGP
jgi:RNA polymerase sigma-70 factor (ECF subfamily)